MREAQKVLNSFADALERMAESQDQLAIEAGALELASKVKYEHGELGEGIAMCYYAGVNAGIEISAKVLREAAAQLRAGEAPVIGQ